MRYLALLGSLVLWLAAHAATSNPFAPWLEPQVLKAALLINLEDDQSMAFRTALAELINGRRKAIGRLQQKRNLSNLEQKVRSITNRHFRKMDKRMASVLSADQMPQYHEYTRRLKTAMLNIARTRARSQPGDTDAARTSLNANNVSH